MRLPTSAFDIVAPLFLLAAAACSHATPAASAPAPPPPDPAPTTPETLFPASVDFDIVNLFMDDKFAYWAHRGEKGLVKVPLGGGPPVTLVPGSE